MSDPIRTCLTFLRNGTLEQANAQGGCLGVVPSWQNLDLSNRVSALATAVIAGNFARIEDADLPSLRKIHAYPFLPLELQNRIFLVGLRMGLMDITPDARAEKARVIAHPVERTAKPYILQGIELLESSGRTETMIAALVSLFEGIEDAHRQAILQTLCRLPETHRRAVLTAIKPSLLVGIEGRKCISILRALASFPPSEHADMVRFTLRLMREITGEKEKILKLVGKLPKERRSDVVEKAMLFMDGITDGKHIKYIFQIISTLPQSQYDVIIPIALLLVQEHVLDGFQRGYLILTLGKIPEALRQDFLSRVSDSAKKNRLGLFLQLFQNLPIRLVFTEEILSTLHSMARYLPPALLNVIFTKIRLIDPSARLEAFNALFTAYREGTLKENEIYSSLFAAFPTLSEDSSDHLLRVFSTSTDAAFVFFYSCLVQQYCQELQLFEDHPLVQTAIKAYAYTEPKALKNPLNPYTLYEDLEELFAVPLELHPPLTTVEEKKVSVSVAPLVAGSEAVKKTLTFAQLPPAVNANTINGLFEHINARLAALTPDQKAQVLEQIQAQSGRSYEVLQQEMRYDPYLQRLLHATGALTDRVPLDVMQYRTVIQFVLDKPDTLVAGALLTLRDDVLLKVAASIDACQGGKKEGVSTAYNWVKGQAATAPSFQEQEARTYLYTIIHRLLDHLLSEDTVLMKQLTGTWDIEHVSHQAIYLKNLLGRALGLVWDLTFDQGTGTLCKPLVQKSTQEILDAFFEHFCPSALIDALQAQVNRDLFNMDSSDTAEREKANTLYHLLFHALDETVTYWKTEEDEFGLEKSVSLTRAGALQLLIKFGYLQPVEI